MLGLLLILVLLMAALVVNTISFKSKQLNQSSIPATFPVNPQSVEHLAASITYPTISYDDGHRDTVAFEGFLNYLDSVYPLCRQMLKVTSINTFTRIYHWKGTDSRSKPALLYAHYDVVPVEEVNRSEWKQDPFSGAVDGGYLWGRGAIDDKIGVVAIMEATEKLLAAGFIPERDVYLVFGHDEEIGGMEGAKSAAEYLYRQGVKTSLHLDEGGLVAHGIVPDMKKPVALIGTAEKGYMTLELTCNLKGGHSSKPARQTAIQLLSTAIHKLQQHPFPKTSAQAVHDFIDYVGPEMPQPLKTVFANAWLFKPLILKVYEGSAEGNAMIRTTGVPTVFDAGLKENLIPGSASVKINFRILSGQSSAEVKKTVEEIIADERIEITEMNNTFEPSKTTRVQSYSFLLAQKVCSKVFPDAVVAPFLDIGSTDSKHFEKLEGEVLRFLPVRMDNEILGTFHGVNERVKVEDYMQTIAFYETLLRELK